LPNRPLPDKKKWPDKLENRRKQQKLKKKIKLKFLSKGLYVVGMIREQLRCVPLQLQMASQIHLGGINLPVRGYGINPLGSRPSSVRGCNQRTAVWLPYLGV